ncbi:hypothetical protein ATANTOWER_001452 [Ataeniobius toweri]|uniref:Uncharacterized protein n=1 Tax=Ataeniobius toweri TaxID=208326 RepID=A0ABU7ADI4_9TELE|nr:hypothetical protein [Ataeniobius toweri]
MLAWMVKQKQTMMRTVTVFITVTDPSVSIRLHEKLRSVRASRTERTRSCGSKQAAAVAGLLRAIPTSLTKNPSTSFYSCSHPPKCLGLTTVSLKEYTLDTTSGSCGKDD